jgi:hypothetical protein
VIDGMTNPQSSEQFEVLMDLLATDDADGPDDQESGTPLNLRNENGQLDFAKIRSFFNHRNGRNASEEPRISDGFLSLSTSTNKSNTDTERFVEPAVQKTVR